MLELKTFPWIFVSVITFYGPWIEVVAEMKDLEGEKLSSYIDQLDQVGLPFSQEEDLSQVEDETQVEPFIRSRFTRKDNSFHNYDYSNDEPEEQDCPRGQWWHLRGQRCVPNKCIGGNRYRDAATGECIIRRRSYNWGIEKGFAKYIPRTVMKAKARGRFALPTKVKG